MSGKELALIAHELLLYLQSCSEPFKLPPAVQTAVSFIRENLNSCIEVPRLAKKAKVSVSTLHRDFKKHIGKTPYQYHSELRTKKHRIC